MRPIRAMGGLLSIALCATMATAADPDRPARRPSFEAELLFERIDLDGDGTISREEWLRFADYTPRMRANPELANQNFNRVDANKDGMLARGEYLPVASMQLQMAAAFQAEKTAAAPMPETAGPQTPVKADGPITPAQLAFFEAKIRPVLIENCYTCHSASAEKLKGNLHLDTREGTRKGGDLGPAVVPGDLDESLLIMAVRYQDDDLKMPPKNKLSDEAIADLERWVAMGAPDPRTEAPAAQATTTGDWPFAGSIGSGSSDANLHTPSRRAGSLRHSSSR